MYILISARVYVCRCVYVHIYMLVGISIYDLQACLCILVTTSDEMLSGSECFSLV